MKILRMYRQLSLQVRGATLVVALVLLGGLTWNLHSFIESKRQISLRFKEAKERPATTHTIMSFADVAYIRALPTIRSINLINRYEVRLQQCGCLENRLSLIPPGHIQTVLVPSIDHVCIQGDQSTDTAIIGIPENAQYLNWLHMHPRGSALNTQQYFEQQTYNPNFYPQAMLTVSESKKDELFCYVTLVRLIESPKSRERFQTYIDELEWWVQNGAIAEKIFYFIGYGSFLTLLWLSFGGIRLQDIVLEAMERYGLEDQQLFDATVEKWLGHWYKTGDYDYIYSVLERDMRKTFRRRRSERGRARNQEMRRILNEQQAQEVETQLAQIEAQKSNRAAHETKAKEAFSVQRRVRKTHGSDVGLLVQSAVLEVLQPRPEKQESDKVVLKRSKAKRKIRACSHDLLGLDEISLKELCLLAEHLRSIKRAMTRETWSTFVEEFDSEEPQTYLPYVQAYQAGELEEVLKKPLPAIQQPLTESQEELQPLLLTGKSVLIVGGLERLSRLYVEQTYSLGAKKVTWRHHSRGTLGKASPDIVLYLFRHSSHSAYDRIKDLGVKDIILVRKHQRTSFLRGLVSDLIEQM